MRDIPGGFFFRVAEFQCLSIGVVYGDWKSG